MALFLSEEWFTAVEETLRAAAEAEDAGALGESVEPLHLGQVVTDGPRGEKRWTIVLGAAPDDPAPRLLVGSTASADVVLVESYDTARGLVSGSLTTAEAIGQGRIKVRGDAARLLSSRQLLTRLGEALAPLAAETSF